MAMAHKAPPFVTTQELAERVGCPHALRHTFATEYLRAGGDLESLRRIMGHSSLVTTQIYLHLLIVELEHLHF